MSCCFQPFSCQCMWYKLDIRYVAKLNKTDNTYEVDQFKRKFNGTKSFLRLVWCDLEDVEENRLKKDRQIKNKNITYRAEYAEMSPSSSYLENYNQLFFVFLSDWRHTFFLYGSRWFYFLLLYYDKGHVVVERVFMNIKVQW